MLKSALHPVLRLSILLPGLVFTACPRLEFPPMAQAGEMVLRARARTEAERKFNPQDESAFVGHTIVTTLWKNLTAQDAVLPSGYNAFVGGSVKYLNGAEQPPHPKVLWQATQGSGKSVWADLESRADVTHLYIRVSVSSNDAAVNTGAVENALRLRIIAEPGITLVAREKE